MGSICGGHHTATSDAWVLASLKPRGKRKVQSSWTLAVLLVPSSRGAKRARVRERKGGRDQTASDRRRIVIEGNLDQEKISSAVLGKRKRSQSEDKMSLMLEETVPSIYMWI